MEEQELFYRNVMKQAAGKPVTFRTLDIGGDKVVPYFRAAEEENPALGWRAIRLSLDRPGLLRTQLRAMLRASAGQELRIMLPMVTEVSELRTVRELLQKEIQRQSKIGEQLPAQAAVRRHAGSAGAAVAAGRTDGRGRFRLGRLQRPVPVLDGGRSRQCAGVRPVRRARPAVPAHPARYRPGGRPQRDVR